MYTVYTVCRGICLSTGDLDQLLSLQCSYTCDFYNEPVFSFWLYLTLSFGLEELFVTAA